MLLFEMKKIFLKASNRIAIGVLLLVVVVVCYFAVCSVDYVNEEGNTETGIYAVQKLKAEKEKWAGVLTEEKLAAVIEENARIVATEEYQSDNVQLNNIAYGWRQGISDIRQLLVYAFCPFREYDYYRPDSLQPKEAECFYGNRILKLEEWLNTEAKEQFSTPEKEYLLQQYRKLETPLLYGYADGWRWCFEFAPTIIMLTVLVLGFMTAGIFSGEFSTKTDAVFFSSYHGRGKAVRAKVQAGILIVTVVYWGMMLLYSAVVLGILGADGASLPIQTRIGGWKSFYQLTNLQEYGLILLGGYLGSLFLTLLTMLVSAKTKSAVLAVTVPFVLIFLPSFLSGNSSAWVNKMLGLFPDQLLQMNQTVVLFQLYEFGGKVMGAVKPLFIIYILLTVLLCPVLYWCYRRTEIK